MIRRYLVPFVASLAFICSTSLLVSAQNGQLRGHVTLKQADGTVVPAADAMVDLFRTDLPGSYTLKTNKKGDFVHAGLPLQGTFIVSVSMAGARPTYQAGVRPGGEDVKIELVAGGDGKRLTHDEIKTAMAGSGSGSTGAAAPSAEDKAKREEIMKKNAAIEAANKKAEASNAIIERTFKAGNEALRAKNFDLAIAQYDEGLNADPDHPGAPALLTNKTMALNARAIDKYNVGVRATDDAAKAAGMDAAKKDWTAATESSSKAVALLKAMPAATEAAGIAAAQRNLYFALLARADSMRLFVPKVDPTKADEGVAAFQEYIAVETDAAKKTKAQNDLAQMLFDSNNFDKALVQYQKILETNPDDLNALLRSGQSLFNIAYANNSDKAKFQEAANYLGQYVAKAPDTDPLKADAKAILDALKEQENVKPAAAPPRRTRRP